MIVNQNKLFFYNCYSNKQRNVCLDKSLAKNYDKKISFESLIFAAENNKLNFFNKLKSAAEKQMFSDLSNYLDKEDSILLNTLLQNGQLLSRKSNDGSSTLENLYMIMKTPRVPGLDNKNILKETVKTIANPFRITQKFGKIPVNIANSLINDPFYNNIISDMTLEKDHTKIKIKDFNVDASGTCVAASIEFNLADKKPAEFSRYVKELTSPNMAVKSIINYKNISPNFIEAVKLLNDFKIENKNIDWENVEVTLKPDRAAIIRARVQNSYQQPGSRSSIDTLLQSTFMQIGSVNTYNSLNDERHGGFNQNSKGLTEYEKNFTEAVVDNTEGGKTSLTYQIVDENAKLVGYNYDFETIKQHLIESLKTGNNIIIGITETNQNNVIIGGHEITVIDYKINNNGELFFICNDTDDDFIGKNEVSAKSLIPKIHHAGIPNKIINLENYSESKYQMLKDYNIKKRA